MQDGPDPPPPERQKNNITQSEQSEQGRQNLFQNYSMSFNMRGGQGNGRPSWRLGGYGQGEFDERAALTQLKQPPETGKYVAAIHDRAGGVKAPAPSTSIPDSA